MQHGRECLTISSLFVFRNFERTAQQLPSHLWRKTSRDIFEAGRDYCRITAKQALKRVHRWIEHGVMLLQERDEIAHLRFVRRKFASVLGDFDKAIAVARFFNFRKQKIQFDKIDVLDFISTTF